MILTNGIPTPAYHAERIVASVKQLEKVHERLCV